MGQTLEDQVQDYQLFSKQSHEAPLKPSLQIIRKQIDFGPHLHYFLNNNKVPKRQAVSSTTFVTRFLLNYEDIYKARTLKKSIRKEIKKRLAN